MVRTWAWHVLGTQPGPWMCYLPDGPKRVALLLSHFADKETQAQRGEVSHTCGKSGSQFFNPGFSSLQSPKGLGLGLSHTGQTGNGHTDIFMASQLVAGKLRTKVSEPPNQESSLSSSVPRAPSADVELFKKNKKPGAETFLEPVLYPRCLLSPRLPALET